MLQLEEAEAWLRPQCSCAGVSSDQMVVSTAPGWFNCTVALNSFDIWYSRLNPLKVRPWLE
jgi:hypothetical protein